MRTTKIEVKELLNVLKDVNAVKVRLGYFAHWVFFPLISFNEEWIEILAKKNSKNYFEDKTGKVMVKCKKDKFEYVISGRVLQKDIVNTIVKISIDNVVKYRYTEYSPRFATKLKAYIVLGEEEHYEGLVTNINDGGAALVTTYDTELSSEFLVTIEMEDFLLFGINAKVMTKKINEEDFFTYGLKFLEMEKCCKLDLTRFINKLRKSSEFIAFEQVVVSASQSNAKHPVALMSFDIEKSAYIEECFSNIGVRNYYLVGTYGALKTSIFEERPNLLIIDGINGDDATVHSIISRIMDEFDDLNIITILNTDFTTLDLKNRDKKEIEDVDYLYYPLLSGELEQVLLKYI